MHDAILNIQDNEKVDMQHMNVSQPGPYSSPLEEDSSEQEWDRDEQDTESEFGMHLVCFTMCTAYFLP